MPATTKVPVVAPSFEQPLAWERALGSTIDRTLQVGADARALFTQQSQLLAALRHELVVDPDAAAHLHDVGRRVRLLREQAAPPDKRQQKALAKSTSKRVVPSRFGDDDDDDDDDGDDSSGATADVDGRIATMLLDQEWDTRTWNSAKVHGATETLYSEVEHSEDENRRELATMMLVRLLETHEDAVEFVETTIPVLMNKAFRNLSKLTNRAQVFRAARLLAVLAEWFAPVLSRENAAGKATRALLRESDICARIVQHHWRGVVFERSLLRREHDPSVCARLRAMHLVKHIELRHQFKALRDAIGPGGLPASAVEAYVRVLYHLTQPRSARCVCSDGASRGGGATADRKKLVSSGALAYLASLVSATQTREVGEMVKAIMLEVAACDDGEYIVDVLACNVVHRVVREIEKLVAQHVDAAYTELTSSVQLVSVLAGVVAHSKLKYESASLPSRSITTFVTTDAMTGAAGRADSSERAYRLKALEANAKKHLIVPSVMHVLFRALQFASANSDLCVNVLDTLRVLARSFGFPEVLDALTRNGGRWLESVTLLFGHPSSAAVSAAVALFHELTDRPDARDGLTTAGAPQLLLGWCASGIETSKTPSLLVLGLIGVALLARQTNHATSAARLLSSLSALSERLDELYSCLFDLVLDERSAEKSATYLLSVGALPSLLQLLVQVRPKCMDSAFQNARQRNVSCVVLGRFVKVAQVAQFCFSEDVVSHLALSLQCNRLDEIEGLVPGMSTHERFVHVLGSKEACKALSRLSRCPSTSVDAKLRPSFTSASVPELPQALICDAMFRLHALEDLVANIKSRSDDGAEFVALELELTLAAVELGGYLRPLPFGEATRARFLKPLSSTSPAQRAYATEKLLALVEVMAPAILHVLREQNARSEVVNACCTALSRLACTNAACSALLTQGCLPIALVHLPEILSVVPGDSSKYQSYVPDSSVDDRRLLDVPASLFTLIGKLCAVAEGRAAVMRAQVLPRLLKRLQLRRADAKAIDDDCKGEIAVVVRQLAMANAVEGNSSELFLHFHVLDLMAQLAREQDVARIVRGKGTPHKWRLLDHALGAIAALSQDVLVCVPKVVALGVLQLLLPFVLRGRKDETLHRAESLQYHAVSIVRSVAAYPFGKYHATLDAIEDTDCPRARATDAQAGSGHSPARLLERVKKVAYNFALELEDRPASSLDKKTVGELARETLAFVHDCAERRNPATKKLTKQSDSDASWLMLDPLFQSSQSSPCASVLECDPAAAKRRKKQQRRRIVSPRESDDACGDSAAVRFALLDAKQEREPPSFEYVHEVDSLGHCVNVRARRATSGDSYVRSLGRIAMRANEDH
ncbi:hypothetical protein PybrP1_006245 [[Pythium] brassicae (nom. inval.)]|nr:hypothetical protein PybrP1_006245 [[Pythium] brassicae (nom. inval.)]